MGTGIVPISPPELERRGRVRRDRGRARRGGPQRARFQMNGSAGQKPGMRRAHRAARLSRGRRCDRGGDGSRQGKRSIERRGLVCGLDLSGGCVPIAFDGRGWTRGRGIRFGADRIVGLNVCSSLRNSYGLLTRGLDLAHRAGRWRGDCTCCRSASLPGRELPLKRKVAGRRRSRREVKSGCCAGGWIRLRGRLEGILRG